MAARQGTAPFSRKRFGQNFLEPAWVDKVIRAIDPKPDHSFIEIGPGRGALTRPLAARAKEVIAYEIDRDLGAELQATAPPNVTVVIGDFLETIANLESRMPYPVRVVGNLPYNVASPILFRLVELSARGAPLGAPLVDATVMLQREVADRLLAGPGSKEYGVLSVLIGHSAKVERLLALPPGAFRPAPKIHSTLVRLTFHPPEPSVIDSAVFAAIVHAVFTRRRKTIANALLALASDPGRTGVGLGSDSGRSKLGPGSEQRSEQESEVRSESSRSRVGPVSELKSEVRSESSRTGVGPMSELTSELGYAVYSRLTPAEALARARVERTRRPETLSIAEFARLADVYATISP